MLVEIWARRKMGRISPAWLGCIIFLSFVQRSWLALSAVSCVGGGIAARAWARCPLKTLFQPKNLSPALVMLGGLNPELVLLLDPPCTGTPMVGFERRGAELAYKQLQCFVPCCEGLGPETLSP